MSRWEYNAKTCRKYCIAGKFWHNTLTSIIDTYLPIWSYNFCSNRRQGTSYYAFWISTFSKTVHPMEQSIFNTGMHWRFLENYISAHITPRGSKTCLYNCFVSLIHHAIHVYLKFAIFSKCMNNFITTKEKTYLGSSETITIWVEDRNENNFKMVCDYLDIVFVLIVEHHL